MAKVKTGAAESDVGPDQEAGQTELAEILSQIGGSARVEIRRRQDNGDWGFLTSVGGDQFDIERISQQWGGGHYQARIRAPDGKGKLVYKAARVFFVDPSVKANPAIAGTVVGTVAPAGPTPMQQMMEVMPLALMQMMFGMMGKMMEQSNSGMASVATLMQAMGPKESAADLVVKLGTMMKQLAPAESSGPMDAVKVLLQGVELGKGLTGNGGDGEGEGGYGTVIKELGLPLLNMLGRQQEREARMKPGVPLAAVTSATVNPPPAVPAATTPTTEAAVKRPVIRPPATWDEFLKVWFPTIAKWAQQGKRPDLYAEFLVDQATDAIKLELLEQLGNDMVVKGILDQIPPELEQYRPWFTTFLNEVKAELAGDEGEEEEEVEATGGEPSGTDGGPS